MSCIDCLVWMAPIGLYNTINNSLSLGKQYYLK